MYIKYSKICLIIASLLVLLILYKYYKTNKKMINKTVNSIGKNIMNFIEKEYKIILFGIITLFFITRLCMLGSIPLGIHVDEASVGYNAFSIAKYGVDRYLNPYPIYFLNFANGQSAMYTYLSAFLIKVFGYSLFILRIPSVIFGFITLIFGYLIGKELVNKKFGVLVALLITICPYFIMASRFALDCNLMLGMFSASIYSLIKAVEKGKKTCYVVSGLLFGLTLYTYALSYIIVPFSLLLVLIYLIYTKKINIAQIICFGIPLMLLAIPLMISVLVQLKLIPQIVTSYFSLLKMNNDRASELSFTISCIIDNIKKIPVLFRNDPYYYNAIPKFGTLYLFSIPFVFLGLLITIKRSLKDIKKRKFNKYMYILLIFIGNFISMLFVKKGYSSINHLNSIYIFLVIFLALGIKKVCEYIKGYWFLIIILYLFTFSYFCYFYFNEYSKWNNLLFFDGGYSLAIKEADKYNDNIYSTDKWNGTLFAALELEVSPYKYQEYSNGFSNIKFNIPEKLDNKHSYVINENEYSKEKFKGFKCSKIEQFYECHKED